MEENKLDNVELEDDDFQKLSDEELWLSSAVADDTHSYDVDKAFARFKRHIDGDRKEAEHYWLSGWRIAVAAVAAIVVLGGISLTAYWKGGQNVQKGFSDIVVEVPLGSKTKLQLPDGSQVLLNAGSRVVYSQGFGVNDRNLEFIGEGYFEVQANKEVPFTVITKDVNVTVLGTKFNFRNYEEDKEAVVDLLEGKVSLWAHLDEGEVKYLLPSEKMVLDKSTGKMNILRSDNVKESVDWTKNVLFFNEDLLSDIVSVLQRAYNVRIVVENDRLNWLRFYGVFNLQTQNVDDVLRILSETKHFKYEKKNGIVYLK